MCCCFLFFALDQGAAPCLWYWTAGVTRCIVGGGGQAARQLEVLSQAGPLAADGDGTASASSLGLLEARDLSIRTFRANVAAREDLASSQRFGRHCQTTAARGLLRRVRPRRPSRSTTTP